MEDNIIYEKDDRVRIVSGNHKGRDGSFIKYCVALSGFCRVLTDKRPREKEAYVQLVNLNDMHLISKNMAKKTTVKEVSPPTLQFIPVDKIELSKLNPRKTINEEELAELAESINSLGLIQAITVRPAIASSENENTISLSEVFEIVCGERRFRACVLAGLTEVPCSVRHLTDAEAMELMVTENLQRKDVSPLEEADSFRFMESNMNYSIIDIAAKISKPESYVIRRMQLLHLVDGLKMAFHENKFSIGHAELLCRLQPNDQEHWLEFNLNSYQGAGTLKELKNLLSNRFEKKLASANFDTTVEINGVVPCIQCPANSSFNSTLFPDKASEAICHNSLCFNSKSEAAFEVMLKGAIEDPDTFLLNDDWQDNELVKKLRSDGHIILKRYDDYTVENEPVMPVMPTLDDYDLEDYDSEEEMKADWREDLETYNEYFANYTEKIKAFSPEKFKKGFYVSNNYKGKSVLISLRTNNKVASAVKGDTTQESIAIQKINIEAKIKRGRELDAEKVMKGVIDHLSSKEFRFSSQPLSEVEFACLFILAYDNKGYSQDKRLNALLGLGENFYAYSNGGQKLFEAILNASDKVKAEIARTALLNKYSGISPGGVNGGVIFNVAREWCPEVISRLELDQEGIRTNREAKLNKQLADLNS